MANLPGTQNGDTVNGTTSADSIVGFQGNDSVVASGGNDTIWAGQGNDTVLGGDGNDVLLGDADRAATWSYRVFDRDFTSANGQAFTTESGTFRGSGLSTGFDPVGHVNAARGTATSDPNDFGIIYTSTFTATTAGTYFFRTTSDDGSTVRLLNSSNTPLTWSNQSTGQTGLTYLNNDFHQPPTTRQGSVTLAAGETYTIEIRVWENLGGQVLSADVLPPGGTWQSLTNNTTFIGTGVYADNDSLDGGAGNDDIQGEGGNDTLNGSGGADTVSGGSGADRIIGGTGNDLIWGGSGSDRVLLDDNHGSDTITGGEDAGNADIDVIDATAVAGNLTVNVSGFEVGTISGAGLGTTFSQIERLELGSGNDTVTVASAADAIQLDGNAGIDRLTINGIPIQRAQVTIDDSAIGSFTPGNGGMAIAFGPSEVLQLSDILAIYKRGEIAISGATPLSGLVGSVNFEDFEQLDFDIICFTRGTRIRTAFGERRIETLRIGDQIATLDHGLQRIRWIGSSLRPAIGDLAPIRIAAGTLGNRRDLLVSPQHRMLLRGWLAELHFGEPEVLVPAKALADGKSVRSETGGLVEYYHILFDRHEIIFAEGAPSESFHPGEQGWKALDHATRAEILQIFPQLACPGFAAYGPAARPSLRGFEARTIARRYLDTPRPRQRRREAVTA